MRMVLTVEDRPSSTRLSSCVWVSVSISSLVCSSVLLSIRAKHLDAVPQGKKQTSTQQLVHCSHPAKHLKTCSFVSTCPETGGQSLQTPLKRNTDPSPAVTEDRSHSDIKAQLIQTSKLSSGSWLHDRRTHIYLRHGAELDLGS